MIEEINPYRAPATATLSEEQTWPIHTASQGRRLGTMVVDWLCIILSSFMVGISIAVIFGDEGMDTLDRIPELADGGHSSPFCLRIALS